MDFYRFFIRYTQMSEKMFVRVFHFSFQFIFV